MKFQIISAFLGCFYEKHTAFAKKSAQKDTGFRNISYLCKA
jgi:hypothetical protein